MDINPDPKYLTKVTSISNCEGRNMDISLLHLHRQPECLLSLSLRPVNAIVVLVLILYFCNAWTNATVIWIMQWWLNLCKLGMYDGYMKYVISYVQIQIHMNFQLHGLNMKNISCASHHVAHGFTKKTVCDESIQHMFRCRQTCVMKPYNSHVLLLPNMCNDTHEKQCYWRACVIGFLIAHTCSDKTCVINIAPAHSLIKKV